jgi:hypothetical protein
MKYFKKFASVVGVVVLALLIAALVTWLSTTEDEQEAIKEALTFIKFLVKNTDYKYILSGSLLGVEMADLRSAPVGYVSELEMFPLDFEEFCWACGIPSNVWQEAESAYVERRPVNEVVHTRLLQLFHSYLCVGGMPAAVAAYVQKMMLRFYSKNRPTF